MEIERSNLLSSSSQSTSKNMNSTKSTLASPFPKNWPHSTEAELAELPSRTIKVGSPQVYNFCNNFVKTSKYEVYNFLPKFLLEEFNPRTKVANCYFLLISGITYLF